MAAHRLPDVTVVADAGMISEANQKAIEAAGLSFILGMKIPDVPYVVEQWRREHPGEDIPDGHVFTQPWPAGPSSSAVTRSFTTSTGSAGPGGRCAGSMSRSPRPPKLSLASRPSSGTGSSPSAAQSRASTANWRPRPGPGRAEGLPHQPRGLPDGTPVTADFVIGSYHELWNREKLPHVEVGSAGPADLPPQA